MEQPLDVTRFADHDISRILREPSLIAKVCTPNNNSNCSEQPKQGAPSRQGHGSDAGGPRVDKLGLDSSCILKGKNLLRQDS